MTEPTTEPSTEQGQLQSAKPAPKRKPDAGQQYIKNLYFGAAVYRPAYLTPKDEAKVSITVTPLDLRSDGNLLDGGPRFIEPASWDAMNEFVERNKPWETYDLGPIRWDEEDDPKQNQGHPGVQGHRWHTGNFMFITLRHFTKVQDPDKCSSFKDDRTWFTGPKWGYRFQSSRSSKEWMVADFLIPKNRRSNPHISVFLSDGLPLRDDALMTGEIAVASGLITLQRCQEGFNGHRYIPITIFSASDRQMRIVQVYHDREEPRALHVRRSRIMEFWNGPRANWEDWITIMCWMMGDFVEDHVLAG